MAKAILVQVFAITITMASVASIAIVAIRVIVIQEVHINDGGFVKNSLVGGVPSLSLMIIAAIHRKNII